MKKKSPSRQICVVLMCVYSPMFTEVAIIVAKAGTDAIAVACDGM